MKKTDLETEQKIIKAYQSGLSMKKVGDIFNVCSVTVKNILERNNISKRTKGGIYKIPEDIVIQRYCNGESCQDIANDYNVAFHTISNILERNNIERNNRYYNLSLDVNYFQNIDSYDKAYFLGFLITDGSININDNTVSLGLNNKDRDILEIFKCKTHSENKLYERKDKPETYFRVKSSKWKQDLSKYGVVPQKTNKVYLPKLKEDLMPHLIRGLIDGDGWISYKAHQIGFCGNEIIVNQLKTYLIEKLQVYPVKTINSKNNPNLYQITWASQRDIERICNYMYENKKDCFLERKFNNFQIIQGNTEVTNQIAKG